MEGMMTAWEALEVVGEIHLFSPWMIMWIKIMSV